MNKLIRRVVSFSLRNKFFIFFAAGLLAIAGYLSFKSIGIEAFPDVTNTSVTVITQWPGRSAEEVERFVTRPLEIAMNTAQKKTAIRSSSLFGLSVVKIIFEDNVDDAFARVQVNNNIGKARLPEGVDPDIQPPYGPTGEIYRYTLESSTKSVRDLKTIQDWTIEKNILAVPGVADIVSFGGEVKTYEITVDPGKAAQYGITPVELYSAVSRSNINVGGDIIVENGQAYVVRGIGILNDVDEIRNIIVDNINGTPVLVSHVADVTVSSLPRLGQVGRDKDPDVVQGIVVMRKGENATEVIEALQKKIDHLNKNVLPADVQIKPFYNRQNLVDFATGTVLHNMMEGIILVTVVVFIFMADWRTTLIVSIVIPLALLFAFVCLKLKGMSANLLSMGAVDFGIIIDGAVVIVEGIFVMLDKRAHLVGMDKFNRQSKLGLIRKACMESGKSIFFAKLIIIAGLLPIFTFEKVEGKMFSPLAWTLGFALLGALILTFTLVPVLSSVLLKKNVKEKHNFFLEFLNRNVMRIFRASFRRKLVSFSIAIVILVGGFLSFKFVGTEFLPQLNEGSIYVRATGPLSTSLDQSVKVANQMRKVFLQFPEVRQVMSQTGRPNDGTDATGFYNVECHIDIYPQKEWKSKLTREQLIEAMNQKLEVIPGISLNFSQPIMDNVEEAVSGVKGSLVVKMYGNNYQVIEKTEDSIFNVLKTVQGIEDLAILRNLGQPELQINLNQQKMALYGITTDNANAVIEMAIGGKAATSIYEGEKIFDLRIRYPEDFRQSEQQIGNLLVPTIRGTKIPIKEIADIKRITGPSIIYRDDHTRYGAIKFSVRGRDMGSTIAEAQQKVGAAVSIPDGYTLQWSGDFENQQRATDRLTKVVPISLLLIFFILFILFGNIKDSALVLHTVLFAITGGIFAMLFTGINFSISAGIGFIALFGICIQNGVILLSTFKSNMRIMKVATEQDLVSAITKGVESRIRPVLMTALMAAIGLLPAAISTGIGSETARPLARVVIGGLITDTIFKLFVFPVVVYWAYRKTIKATA
ncbi:efflux RND transporter permease subunit [Pseudoflavitalea sp. G-6-1-2]|uniref:efflux RND transporter permease subunit n=1 Tax=Pseudoflavitalea sp. G-6-1-2 TaxID=2728841 RepID=UPI00146E6B58|nr:CusA/CzcA family heavy metal efflux RND transporter [Pseudoflavitalea sp. G-6-1-2]NML22117.1 efflux RND transporter permease subunit [Pseudoflavitalea sp. G-6-1-2]